MSDTVQAFKAVGVGGFVTRTPHGVQAILQFVLPSGEELNIALDDELLAATDAKAIELRTVVMETGELMRDLGLYSEG
ncbi:MAG: hypothetical protein HYZ38_27635 [Mycobacterium sp.]|nr:hypothetical protein [Mycobacterium sp.]